MYCKCDVTTVKYVLNVVLTFCFDHTELSAVRDNTQLSAVRITHSTQRCQEQVVMLSVVQKYTLTIDTRTKAAHFSFLQRTFA